MNRLVVSISFFIILFIPQPAKTAITCSLPLRSPTLYSFGNGAKPSTSGLSAFSIRDFGFSLFDHLYKTPDDEASDYDNDAPEIFTQIIKVSGPGWIDDLNEPMFFANRGDFLNYAHFRPLDVYSHDDHHSKRNSWFPAEGIEDIDTRFAKNDGSTNLRTLVLTNYYGWIPDVEDNVIDVVPAPGAIILGGLGVGTIGWLRRCKSL